MNNPTLSLFFAIGALAGCTTVTDVTQTGKNTYMIGASDRVAWRSSATLQAMTIQRAQDFCKSKGQIAQIGERETRGVQGLWPTGSAVTFSCVNE